MTKALIVKPDGSKEYVDQEMTYEFLKETVGGWIEFVFVTEGVHLYCNEEGKLLGLPVNIEATRLAGRLGVDLLCGTVIFLGDRPDDGEEHDLPPEWLGQET